MHAHKNVKYDYSCTFLYLQVLKLYAWEPSFEKKVADIRNKELDVLKKAAYLNAISTFFWTSAPFLVSIRGLDSFGRFSLIFYKGENFCDFLFVFCSVSSQVPFLKGSTLKGKNLLPLGSKFFPFRVDLFSEGSKNYFGRVVSLESVSAPLESCSAQNKVS